MNEKIIRTCACGVKLSTSAGNAGKRMRCPRCSTVITIENEQGHQPNAGEPAEIIPEPPTRSPDSVIDVSVSQSPKAEPLVSNPTGPNKDTVRSSVKRVVIVVALAAIGFAVKNAHKERQQNGSATGNLSSCASQVHCKKECVRARDDAGAKPGNLDAIDFFLECLEKCGSNSTPEASALLKAYIACEDRNCGIDDIGASMTDSKAQIQEKNEICLRQKCKRERVACGLERPDDSP